MHLKFTEKKRSIENEFNKIQKNLKREYEQNVDNSNEFDDDGRQLS